MSKCTTSGMRTTLVLGTAAVVCALFAAWAIAAAPKTTEPFVDQDDGFDPRVHASYTALPPPPAHEAWALSKHVYDYALGHPGTVVMSDTEPRLLLLKSFVSPEERDHLVARNKPRLEPSKVLSGDADKVRTSMGAWVEKSDPVAQRVQDRIHRTVGIPLAYGEDIYVLNYQQRQEYKKHNDHCMDTGGVASEPCLKLLRQGGGPSCGRGAGGPTCGDRLATVIIYLKTPELGGRTVFPEAAATKAALGTLPIDKAAKDGVEWYCSNPKVLGVAPKAGDAVLFWNYTPGDDGGSGGDNGAGTFADGSAKPAARRVFAAMHSGCPVIKGEKWITTRWIRSAPFNAN